MGSKTDQTLLDKERVFHPISIKPNPLSEVGDTGRLRTNVAIVQELCS